MPYQLSVYEMKFLLPALYQKTRYLKQRESDVQQKIIDDDAKLQALAWMRQNHSHEFVVPLFARLLSEALFQKAPTGLDIFKGEAPETYQEFCREKKHSGDHWTTPEPRLRVLLGHGYTAWHEALHLSHFGDGEQYPTFLNIVAVTSPQNTCRMEIMPVAVMALHTVQVEEFFYCPPPDNIRFFPGSEEYVEPVYAALRRMDKTLDESLERLVSIEQMHEKDRSTAPSQATGTPIAT